MLWFKFTAGLILNFPLLLSIFILNYIRLHIIIKFVCSSSTFLQKNAFKNLSTPTTQTLTLPEAS